MLINYDYNALCCVCNKIVQKRKGYITRTWDKHNPLKRWKAYHRKCYELKKGR
jgi:hypothetical protein